MPQLRAAAVLQLGLLLSAVPAQYFISRWSGSTAAQRYHASTRLVRIWRDWRKSYLNSTVWMEWANKHFSKVMYAIKNKYINPVSPMPVHMHPFVIHRSLVGLEDAQMAQESLALEAMIFDNDQGFFGASKTVRSPRPPYVFLRVGEVVMESKRHMVGVVVSWDPELRAPQKWIDRVYSVSEGLKAENTPHYKVVFGGHDDNSVIIGYLPQTQLERITGLRPDIPTLENYFTHYDGERFAMQPWLRELFPEDVVEDEEPFTW